MFNQAKNLSSITGSILSTGDSEWASVTTVGSHFFYRTFSRNKLTELPEGSFNTSNITTVGNDFFSLTFQHNQLKSLPG
jgi:hypothetical protein